MSQRLCIGEPPHAEFHADFFDCVITKEEGAFSTMMEKWICCTGSDGIWLGPLKMWINDLELWEKVEPAVVEIFEFIGQPYPDKFWWVVIGDDWVEHPTRDELQALVEKAKLPENLTTTPDSGNVNPGNVG